MTSPGGIATFPGAGLVSPCFAFGGGAAAACGGRPGAGMTSPGGIATFPGAGLVSSCFALGSSSNTLPS